MLALRATTEAGWARGRLRRPVARPVGGLVNKFPAANGALPQPLRAFLASPDTEARRSGGTRKYWKSHTEA